MTKELFKKELHHVIEPYFKYEEFESEVERTVERLYNKYITLLNISVITDVFCYLTVTNRGKKCIDFTLKITVYYNEYDNMEIVNSYVCVK